MSPGLCNTSGRIYCSDEREAELRNSAQLELREAGGGGTKQATIENLVIAGWTGRNQKAMEAHIRELEAMGIARPKTTPIFYRVAAGLLTTADTIQVPGNDSSGEVETVILSLDDGLWVAVGSDHTDRKVEAIGVTTSKQLCAKPIGADIWRYDDVADHWDELILRSHAIENGERRLYQEGPAGAIRHPDELTAMYLGEGGRLAPGWAMFCGTHPAIGGIGPAESFEIELEDPVRGRKISHRYAIETLPVEG